MEDIRAQPEPSMTLTPYTWGVLCFLSNIIVPSLASILLSTLGAIVKMDLYVTATWGVCLATALVMATIQWIILKRFNIHWLVCYGSIMVGFIAITWINIRLNPEAEFIEWLLEFNDRKFIHNLVVLLIRMIIMTVVYFIIFYTSAVKNIFYWICGSVAGISVIWIFNLILVSLEQITISSGGL